MRFHKATPVGKGEGERSARTRLREWPRE
jgi:hypothetical protein